MRKRELPKTIDVLKALSYTERAKLWAKYSPYPFKRQNRSLWYYIQCDQLYCAHREWNADVVIQNPDQLRKHTTTKFHKLTNLLLNHKQIRIPKT